MMRLTCWSCIMMNLTSKKAWGKMKEQVFRKGSSLIHRLQNMSYQKILILILHPGIMLSMMKYHQPLLISLNKLWLFRKHFYQKYLSWMTKHQTKNKETKHSFLQKISIEKGKWIWYCLLYLLSHQLLGRVIE